MRAEAGAETGVEAKPGVVAGVAQHKGNIDCRGAAGVESDTNHFRANADPLPIREYRDGGKRDGLQVARTGGGDTAEERVSDDAIAIGGNHRRHVVAFGAQTPYKTRLGVTTKGLPVDVFDGDRFTRAFRPDLNHVNAPPTR